MFSSLLIDVKACGGDERELDDLIMLSIIFSFCILIMAAKVARNKVRKVIKKK